MMKKWKMSIIAALLLLTGCQTSDQQAPVLTLSKSRVQVALNEKIDYSTYILKAVDDVDGDLTDQSHIVKSIRLQLERKLFIIM